MFSAVPPISRLLVWDTTGTPALFGAYEKDIGGEAMISRLEWSWNQPKSQSEWLFRAVHAATEFQGWDIASVSAIGVVTGPGSFTGIRVGLALARTWAQTVGLKLFVTSSLSLELSASQVDAVVRRAATGEWYLQWATNGAPFEEEIVTDDEFGRLLESKFSEFPDRPDLRIALERSSPLPDLPAPVKDRVRWVDFSAQKLGKFAENIFSGQHEAVTWPLPHYLREADATRKLKLGLLKPQPAMRQG